jgi:hypothetical protein
MTSKPANMIRSKTESAIIVAMTSSVLDPSELLLTGPQVLCVGNHAEWTYE